MSYKQRCKRERNDIILKLVKQGVSTKDIARQLRCSVTVVQNVRRDAGLAPERRVWDDDKLARAREMLDDGAACSEIDRTLGIPRGSTRAKFPGEGWTPADRVMFENDTGQRRKPELRRPSFLDVAKPATPSRGTPFA